MNNTANNMTELLSLRRCGEETFHDLSRSTYKYTSCGAWVSEDEQGVTLGSIVEGADYDCQSITLKYPFKIDEFWRAIQSIEDEADLIWKRENEDHEMSTL